MSRACAQTLVFLPQLSSFFLCLKLVYFDLKLLFYLIFLSRSGNIMSTSGGREVEIAHGVDGAAPRHAAAAVTPAVTRDSIILI